MKQEIAGEVGKSSPAVTITALAAVEAITLNQWVAVATLFYIVLQASYLGWKWWKEYKATKE